jgi:hypothetical protein
VNALPLTAKYCRTLSNRLNFAELCRTLSKSMAQRTHPQLSTSAARDRLAALGEKKPRTKAAQLRMLWPEIKAALDRGHTLKAVCECLEADGIQMAQLLMAAGPGGRP